MAMVNVHEAKTHFSRLLAEVEGGGDVTIARAGKPVAKLVPIERLPRRQRRLGALAGQGFQWNEANWTDADQKDLEASFYDGPIFTDES